MILSFHLRGLLVLCTIGWIVREQMTNPQYEYKSLNWKVEYNDGFLSFRMGKALLLFMKQAQQESHPIEKGRKEKKANHSNSSHKNSIGGKLHVIKNVLKISMEWIQNLQKIWPPSLAKNVEIELGSGMNSCFSSFNWIYSNAIFILFCSQHSTLHYSWGEFLWIFVFSSLNFDWNFVFKVAKITKFLFRKYFRWTVHCSLYSLL